MPNYSHGTKLTLAAADEPPYLTVGTDVSAKYKGAFCEAKIIDVNKHVKLRVLFDGTSGSHLIDDTELKAGSTLEVGAKVDAKHPEKKQQVFLPATVSKILDHSRYTVVFDDGDQCILRRNSLCLKSGKHFAESETLDQLPLTNPEHFGNPVKAEQFNHNQLQNPNSSTNNPTVTANQSINRSSATNNNVSNSANNNVSSTHMTGSHSTTNGRAAAQNYVKQEKHDEDGKSSKANKSAASNTANSGSVTPGRRGGTGKGRKRRESTSHNSKNTPDVDDDINDSSQDSTDPDPAESGVNFDLIEIGVKLMVQYGKGKVQNVYEAKVNKIETNSAGRIRYFVHYTGWNNRYDEWITRNRVLSIVSEKENGAKDGRTKQHSSESAIVDKSISASNSNSTNTATVSKMDVATPVKENEIDTSTTKTPRRSRLKEISTSTATKSTSSASVTTSTTINTTTNTLSDSTSGISSERSAKSKDKEAPATKTRRSRQAIDSSANSAATSSSASSTSSTASNNANSTAIKEGIATATSAPALVSNTKPGRQRQYETNITQSASDQAASSSNNTTKNYKEYHHSPAKTRRSKQADISSTNPVSNNSTVIESPSSDRTVPTSPPKQSVIYTNQTERVKSSKDAAETALKQSQQNQSEPNGSHANQKSASASTTTSSSKGYTNQSVTKEKDLDKEHTSHTEQLPTPTATTTTKTRGSSRQSESLQPTATGIFPTATTHSPSSLTTTTSSSASSTSSSSAGSTNTTTTTTAATVSTTTTNSTATVFSSSVVSVASTQVKDLEKDKERDRTSPIKNRRSRQICHQETSNNSSACSVTTLTGPAATAPIVANLITSATTTAGLTGMTTTTSTSTPATTSAPLSNSSTSSSTSSSSSSSVTYSNTHILASFVALDRDKFKDLPIIDEPDCDKRISILQDKIMFIKQTYMTLRSELADLDRKRKRPRLERSNSDHINFNGVTCRN